MNKLNFRFEINDQTYVGVDIANRTQLADTLKSWCANSKLNFRIHDCLNLIHMLNQLPDAHKLLSSWEPA